MNRDMKDEKVPPKMMWGKQQVQRTWGRNKLEKLEEKQGGECDCSRVSWERPGRGESERSAGARPPRALEAMTGRFGMYFKSNKEPLKVSEQRMT